MPSTSGSMRETPLPDIIQLVCQSNRAGVFVVENPPYTAKLYVRDGRIIHAASAKGQGMAVIGEIAAWQDGTYAFHEGDNSGIVPSITSSTIGLLQDLDRQIQEWRILSRRIESIERYPYLTLIQGEDLPDLKPLEQAIIPFINGHYSVEELALATKKPILAVAKTLYSLMAQGHIVLKGVRNPVTPAIPSPTPVPAPEPAAPVAEDSKYVAFARRLRDTAIEALPPTMHGEINALYESALPALNDNAADGLKALARSISRVGVEGHTRGDLSKDSVAVLNTAILRLFGK